MQTANNMTQLLQALYVLYVSRVFTFWIDNVLKGSNQLRTKFKTVFWFHLIKTNVSNVKRIIFYQLINSNVKAKFQTVSPLFHLTQARQQ